MASEAASGRTAPGTGIAHPTSWAGTAAVDAGRTAVGEAVVRTVVVVEAVVHTDADEGVVRIGADVAGHIAVEEVGHIAVEGVGRAAAEGCCWRNRRHPVAAAAVGGTYPWPERAGSQH